MSLIYELKANNELALREVFRMFQRPLFKYVFDKTRSTYITAEVVQLAFIKLWRYRNSLRDDVDLSCQVFRIARSVLIDELRKQQTLHKTASAKYIPVYTEDVSDSVFYNDTVRKLEDLIQQMPPVRQHIFRLSRLHNYSHKEIAAMLSISTKTVENHINLALKFIKPFFSVLILVNALIFKV